MMKKLKCKAPQLLKKESVGEVGIWISECDNDISFYQTRDKDGSHIATFRSLDEARTDAQERYAMMLLMAERQKYLDVGLAVPPELLTDEEKENNLKL